MGATQFGFKQAMSMREALFGIQVLVQNCRDVQKDLFLCFIDYEKAFDRVQHDALIEILTKLDIDGKDIRCIKNLYWNQEVELKIGEVKAEQLAIKREVRQGCILSPLLFNLYSQYIFENAIAEEQKGVKVNGVFINNIRYADDTTLIADSVSDLQHLVDKVSRSSGELGLTMNVRKTKFMVISRKNIPYSDAAIIIDGKRIERMQKFKYLGSWLSQDWNPEAEVRTRVELARAAFVKYKKVLCNRELNISLRIRYLKCYVWSVLLYGAEAWTLKASSMNKLEAFEIGQGCERWVS